ncbi:winged helix-turn-helix transcriptional regulator [Pimelobacter sp. 30-1]|uniref:winged helix-turn-helix transcriptional regulator n=1 Tax=Pimelobacter sp. 30-1 TaxID=2004991 RepID=UPI001C046430|nr:winged helix-turn-helix transcriptional regulator [Pimelobacter sp. 30-1]MBU2693769.1 transcriptional regulator [Pimelobacter sp. 30-1]
MKSYGQFCGLARSLDTVGDRWNLLIVRQLLIGPARYGDLRAGLPGLATNLLADRLRDLESAGVVRREVATEGNAVAYALTEWGAELREPIEALIRWSTPLMVEGPRTDHFDPGWLHVALPALLRERAPGRRTVTIGLAVDGAPLLLRFSRSGPTVEAADGRAVDATVRTSAHVLLGLAAGALTLADAQAWGAVEVEGDLDAVREVLAGAA